MTNIKLVAFASRGGHWVQLKKIIGELNLTATTISTFGNDEATVLVEDFSRDSPIKALKCLYQCFRVASKTNASTFISTGAAPGVLLCILFYLKGTKVIWIDSIANSKKISFSCRLVKYFSHIRLTQWRNCEDLNKKIFYKGSIF
jgi:hypothetical protein